MVYGNYHSRSIFTFYKMYKTLTLKNEVLQTWVKARDDAI